MEGFLDIQGTEICQGDTVLFADTWGNNSPKLRSEYLVTGFTPKFMKMEAIGEDTSVWYNKTKIAMHRTCDRVLIMKGEFKTYTKEEMERHDG